MKLVSAFLVLLGLSAFAAVAQDETDLFGAKVLALQAKQDYPAAIALCTRAIEEQPGNERIYFWRAGLYALSVGYEDIEAAVADVHTAVRLKPNDESVILIAAGLLNKANRHAEARDILTAFISANPKSVMALYTRSYSNRGLDDLTSALEDITRARELDPKNVLLQNVKMELQRLLGDPAAVIARSGKMVRSLEAKLGTLRSDDERARIRRDISTLYWTRSNSYGATGDREKQLDDASKAVGYTRNSVNYERRALIYIDHYMYAEAIADFTDAIRLSDHPTALLLNRGEAYVLNKQFVEAVKDYETALKHPDTVNKALIEARLAEIKLSIGS